MKNRLPPLDPPPRPPTVKNAFHVGRLAGLNMADKMLSGYPTNWRQFTTEERAGFLRGLADAFDAFGEGYEQGLAS